LVLNIGERRSQLPTIPGGGLGNPEEKKNGREGREIFYGKSSPFEANLIYFNQADLDKHKTENPYCPRKAGRSSEGNWK